MPQKCSGGARWSPLPLGDVGLLGQNPSLLLGCWKSDDCPLIPSSSPGIIQAPFSWSILFPFLDASGHAVQALHQFPRTSTPFQALHQFWKNSFKLHMVVGMGHITASRHPLPTCSCSLPSHSEALAVPQPSSSIFLQAELALPFLWNLNTKRRVVLSFSQTCLHKLTEAVHRTQA